MHLEHARLSEARFSMVNRLIGHRTDGRVQGTLRKRVPVDESEIIRYLNDTLCDNASHLIFRNASYAVQKRCRRLEKIMSRIAPVVPTNTGTKVAATLSQVKASLDKVTNVHCV